MFLVEQQLPYTLFCSPDEANVLMKLVGTPQSFIYKAVYYTVICSLNLIIVVHELLIFN